MAEPTTSPKTAQSPKPLTRLGLQIPNFTYSNVSDSQLFDRIVKIAKTAEETGFDSIWVMDHFQQIPMVGPSTDPMMEAYTLLSALVPHTKSINLGALVTGVTHRNPALVAKTVTTLDVISSGRAILGIGAAWNQQEHESMGIAFPPVKQRFEMLEEALQICRSMFKSPSTTFLGNHYRLVDAMNLPQPLRPGGPPILIGGSGERKTLKLVAKYANACNLFGDVPTIAHKLSVLNHHCEQVARDPSEITKTRLGVLVIADTNADAKRESTKLIAQAADRGVPPQQTSGTLIAGDLNQVSEQVAEYLATGLDGMIFSIHNVYRLEPIIMAAEALEKLLKLSH